MDHKTKHGCGKTHCHETNQKCQCGVLILVMTIMGLSIVNTMAPYRQPVIAAVRNAIVEIKDDLVEAVTGDEAEHVAAAPSEPTAEPPKPKERSTEHASNR